MARRSFSSMVVESWYSDTGWTRCLSPLAALFQALAVRRRNGYLSGARASVAASVPVIVVGNITVGGTGKTPLVGAMVEHLRSRGFSPGIVSRGYGGKAKQYPLLASGDSDPVEAGDEPVMLAQATGCPVGVDPDRPAAIDHLLATTDTDIVISDDGLQHYRMSRDIEIVVLDGSRGLGNGMCLPAGPLREPASRLQSVDLVICNGSARGALPVPAFSMNIVPRAFVNLVSGERQGLEFFAQREVHGIAGIGNPDRFFKTLAALNCNIQAHAFPDHHAFKKEDIQFDDAKPVVMTEKDAIKCASCADSRHWFLQISAEVDDGFWAGLDSRLEQLPKAKIKQRNRELHG